MSADTDPQIAAGKVLWHFKPASGFFSLIKPVDYTSTTTLYFYSITQ